MSSAEMITARRQATIVAAGVIAAAYHVCGRSAEDARTAIIEWLNTRLPDSVEMTVGDLFSLTDY